MTLTAIAMTILAAVSLASAIGAALAARAAGIHMSVRAVVRIANPTETFRVRSIHPS